MLGQHNGNRLEHQGVAGRPKIDSLAILERDPGEQAEAIAARRQRDFECVLLLPLSLPKRPHVGVGRMVVLPFADLGEGRVQHVIKSKLCEDRHAQYPWSFTALLRQRFPYSRFRKISDF